MKEISGRYLQETPENSHVIERLQLAIINVTRPGELPAVKDPIAHMGKSERIGPNLFGGIFANPTSVCSACILKIYFSPY